MGENSSTDLAGQDSQHRLRAGSIGLFGVMLLLIGATGPLLAVLGNVPLEVSAGNGIYAPSGYVLWIVGLLLFAVGYSAMANRLVSSGGFYSYISHGLGRPAGMAAGWSALAAYAVGEAGLFGALGYFAQNTFLSELHLNLSWLVYSVLGLVVVTALSYRDIRLSTKILGVLGLTEVLLLLIVSLAVLFRGGAHGITLAPLNPLKAFTGPSPALGLMFAFLSWVGFEMIPNYAEETANPKKNIGRGLYIGVLGLGVLYILAAWAGIVGHGLTSSVASATSDPVSFYYVLSSHFVGGWATVVMKWLIVTSTFAACLVWHQTTARYYYVLGREGIGERLGRTHPRYRSPHMAVLFQAGVVFFWFAVFLIFYATNASARTYAGNFATAPYAELFAWLLVATIMFILVNEVLCSIAVVAYFRKEPKNSVQDWLRTVIAPTLATILMTIMLVVAVVNVGSLGGDIVFVKAIPWVCIVWIAIGFVVALWLRAKRPAVYARVGALIDVLGSSHAGQSEAHAPLAPVDLEVSRGDG
ncbi:MAG TPA: APC family permease [Acidimicrobiales bacterium]|nr:APC family permease [Acidimicrobiales bacterium]